MYSGTGCSLSSCAGVTSATAVGYAQLAYGAVVQTDAGAGLVSNGDTGEIGRVADDQALGAECGEDHV